MTDAVSDAQLGRQHTRCTDAPYLSVSAPELPPVNAAAATVSLRPNRRRSHVAVSDTSVESTPPPVRRRRRDLSLHPDRR